MRRPIITEVWSIPEIYNRFDSSFSAALQALHDTKALERPQALLLMTLLAQRAQQAGSIQAVVRLTQKCDAIRKRYGPRAS